MTLLATLRDFCLQQGLAKTYWVAYSGGLDSQVLLSLCQQLRTELPLQIRAIHINHGIHPSAFLWEQHCVQVCEKWEIDLTVERLSEVGSTNIEHIAREKRYAIFANYINTSQAFLLTAHHQNDQAETLLLQLFRGAGPKGLAAMPFVKSFAQGMHARPLLSFSREALEEYARVQQLNWVDDTSNQDTTLTRNFLRQTILPTLAKRWPSITQTLARSATHCAEAQTLLDEYAYSLYQSTHGHDARTLSVRKLLEHTPAQQRLILRYWITKRGFPLPDATRLITLQQTILTAAPDKSPHLHWGNTEIRRFRDDLHIMPCLPPHSPHQIYPWTFHPNATPLTIPNIGHLTTSLTPNQGLRPTLSNLTVRFRQGGESIKTNTGHTQTLKNLFNQWNIPPWQRNRIPLIFFRG